MTRSAEKEVVEIRNLISHLTGYDSEDIKSRVKPPQSQFFRHLKHHFHYEKMYDLIAFRILTDGIEESMQIYHILTSENPLPPNMQCIWNPLIWDYAIGAQNSLVIPSKIGYRSLDFHIYLKDKRVIAEVQTRPATFEEVNDTNYLTYKNGILQLVRLEVDTNFEKLLAEGTQKIKEWESLAISQSITLGEMIRLYGANYNE